ncbi:hypothetical protein WR25_20673 [Diploscapter pachys]|uniref:Uncharacterized protein n=1 Tax=Diploscapter pachys TaxID=2018661 RepID=A0A2A2J5I5_9BILA|nr:hypothetical protein WR25_20673 [Diploscapter pachys]
MISSSTESNLPSQNETKEMKSSKKHRFLVSLVLFIEPLLLFGASIFALYAMFPLFGYRMILGIICILVLTTPFVLLFFFAALYIFTSLPLNDVQDVVDAKSRTFSLAYACLTGRYAMIGVLLLCASTLIIVGLMRSGIERAFQQQFLYTLKVSHFDVKAMQASLDAVHF